MKKLGVFFLYLFCTGSIIAQETEIFHRISIKSDPSDRAAIISKYYLDHYQSNKTEIIVELPESEIAQMRDDGLEVKVLIEDMAQWYAERLKQKGGAESRANQCIGQAESDPQNFHLGSMGGYLTYEEILQELDEMGAAYPSIFKARSGISNFTTHQGRPIYYVKISDNADTDEIEPRVLYSAHIHAREAITSMQLLYYMWYMLEQYALNPEIKYLIDNSEMYFVPVLNPDGFKRNQTNNPNGGGMHRKNMRNVGSTNPGVDLNRNFDIYWNTTGVSANTNNDTYPGPSAASEPETQAYKWLADHCDFSASLTHHAYANQLLFPFGYDYVPTPDSAFFQDFTAEMVSVNGFENTQSVNLYPASGDTDDWLYTATADKPKVYAMTPESGGNGDGFWPAQNRIFPMCRNNLKMNLDLVRFATKTAVVKEKSSLFLAQQQSHIAFDFKRFGLINATYTLSLEPISSAIASVGAPKVYSNTTQLQVYSDSIALNIAGGTLEGTPIEFVLKLDNGDFIFRDTIQKIYGIGNEIFFDDASQLSAYSQTGGTWSTTGSTYVSAPTSITDSPSGNYANGLTKRIFISNPIALHGSAAILGSGLHFWAKWNIEKGYDYVQVEASDDNGQSWTPLCGKYTKPGTVNQDEGKPLYDGVQDSWVKEEIDLSAYLGSDIQIRFSLITDGGVRRDGFYFDDLKITYMYSSLSVEQSIAQKLRLYPNPAGDQVYIEGLETGSDFRLINSLGQIIYSGLSQGDKTGIQIQGLEPGYYILTSNAGNIAFIKK